MRALVKIFAPLFFLPMLALTTGRYPAPVFAQSARAGLHTVTFTENRNLEYVALGELAAFLNLRTFYSEKTRKTILYLGSTEVKVTAMNPFVQIDDRMAQLPYETRYANDEVFVPLYAFANLIRPYYRGAWPERLRRKSASDTSSAAISATRKANITSIVVEGKANGTLIRIQTSEPFARKHVSTRFSRDWLYVDIVGGRLAANAVGVAGAGIVKEVRPVQTGMVTQLSFRLQKEVAAEQINISTQGNTILVSLPTQEVVPEAVLRNLEMDRQKWRIDTIVLDPGHGGRDPGAIGPNGTKEKDIALQVALRLKKLLENELGVRVKMTRENDTFVKLEDRTSIANTAQGKMFISLHCNANKSRRVDGTTTYFLGPAKTDEALEVALLENSVVKYETEDGSAAHSEEEFILTAMAQNAFHHESQSFAQIIQEEMKALLGLPDRGVEQAGFRVLVGASMPNVLVEMAFISNRKEEQLLNSGETQQKIARAIMHSVKRFKEKYEQGS